MVKWWVLQGAPDDWERSFKDIDEGTREFLWAFSESGKHYYNKIGEGDKVLFISL